MIYATHNGCVLHTEFSVGYPINRRYIAASFGLNLAASGDQKLFPCCSEYSALTN